MNIKIVVVDICFIRGFVSVLYLFKLIVVSVNEEEVENIVINGDKILYIIFLKGYLLFSFFKVKINGMLIIGVIRLYRVRLRMSKFGGVCIFFILIIILMIKLFLI